MSIKKQRIQSLIDIHTSLSNKNPPSKETTLAVIKEIEKLLKLDHITPMT